MKQIHIYIIISLLILGTIGCDDNIDFSKPHLLTDEEIAEIARQDSIEEAQRTRINADLVLEYTVEITISNTLYDGVMLPIEIDKIAGLFGISEEDVLAGIAGEAGAPEIKGFAIEGTTRADNGTASTTNSPWGHWWNADGDVTTWGETAVTFAEFNYETGEFNIGQYPGRFTDGQILKIIEALRFDDKRVAVVITINAKAPEQVVATVVSTQNLSLDVTPKSSYDAEPLQFDLDDVLNSLGIESMEDVGFLGVKPDGSYDREAVTGKGFWYDMDGYVGSWGDDASVFTNYGDFAENEISIGQFPDRLTEGFSLNIQYGFIANNKIVMLNITINVLGYQDPETPPAGEPQDLAIDVDLTKEFSTDYASVTYDIKETLRDAFKMTTYQIHKAIGNGELKLYQGEITEENPAYTADVPGYWLTSEGVASGWGESVVWCSIGHNETDLYLYGGNHPDNAEPGSVINTTLIATCNGGSVTINLTFNVN